VADAYALEDGAWLPLNTAPPPDPIPDPDPDPDPDPGDPQTPTGTWPTLAQAQAFVVNKASLPSVGSITTTSNGQVIENVRTTGLIRIAHSNVIVRNVYFDYAGGAGAYAISTTASNIGNILIENVEVAGQRLMNGIRTIAMNFPGVNSQGLRLRRIYVHGVGSGPRFYDNNHIEDALVLADHYAGSSSHRSGIGNNGGAHCSISRCRLECTGAQSSAAISLYGDNALADDHLFQDNLLVCNDGYIAYGGSVSSKAFPVGRDVRYLRNHFMFKTPYSGPLYGALTAFTGGNGNVSSQNVWETSVTLNSGATKQAGDPI